MKKTDLMIEFSSKLMKNKEYKKVSKKLGDSITKTVIKIDSDEVSKKYGREKGSYITFSLPFDYLKLTIKKEKLINELKSSIKDLIKECDINNLNSVLVVGLGNSKMVADCFGSKVVDKILITRHAIKSGLKLDEKLTSVSAISCGVFGQTGFESFDVIKGICDNIKPDLVILIDTLVASCEKKLCSNIQMANVGIIPGSGVENNRKEISFNTLKVKTITIGVPFVVYAKDLFEGQIENIIKKFIGHRVEYNLDNKGLASMVVMPSDIENYIKFYSSVIASSINEVLNPNLDKTSIETFFN